LTPAVNFNSGDINETELIIATAMLGFNNVIDAFHVVSGSAATTRFFVDERRTATPGIRLTDELLRLAGQAQAGNLSGSFTGDRSGHAPEAGVSGWPHAPLADHCTASATSAVSTR
jgi:hypothetical protein